MKIELGAILIVAFVLMMAFVVGCGTPGEVFDPLYPPGQIHGPVLPQW